MKKKKKQDERYRNGMSTDMSNNVNLVNEVDRIEKSREFCSKVKELAKQYNLSFFVVTDGASAILNNGCEAVKHARDCHIEWEKQHNFDPFEDWSKDK